MVRKRLPDDTPAWLVSLGDAIFERRGGRFSEGLRKAAREIGISPATLSRIESGKAPDLKTFRKLCLWLGKSADDLLGLKGEGKERWP